MTEPKKGKEDFIVQKVKGCKEQVFRVVRNEIPAELLPLLTMAFTEEQRQQIFKQVGLYSAKRVQAPQRPKALLIFGPPAVGKSTISTEVARSLFEQANNVVVVDGNDVRDAHEGFSKVARHSFKQKVLHSDAWDILKATKHVENLKKEIMSMAIQNRQDMIIPECALKPERVHQMIKKMEDADYEMHAICLWAAPDAVLQRGRERSVKAGKAYSPKFHAPSCAEALEFGSFFDQKIREGRRHYGSLICYDNTAKPSHPVHLAEFEYLVKMGPEECKEHTKNCMLAHAPYDVVLRANSSSSADSPLEVQPTMLQAALRRGRQQGLLAGLSCALLVAVVVRSCSLGWRSNLSDP